MNNVAAGKKKILATVVLACVCVALIAIPASALWYVHSDEATEGSTAQGAIPVIVTLDVSAQGEGVETACIMVPSGCTAQDVLYEDINSSEDQNGLDAIHNYDYENLATYLDGRDYTITVYEAGSQAAGTQATYDSEGTADASTVLDRYDSVVITVSK